MRLGLLGIYLLAGCSGAVSDPASAPPPPGPIVVTPSSATAYPGLSTTFSVTGGSGGYAITSDNQGVIASLSTFAGGFTLIPTQVSAETKFNLIVQGSTTVMVPVTIEPLTTAPLTAAPAALSFQGVLPNSCASNIQADVLVFGGTPPYIASQPASFTVNPTVLTTNPGRLTVTAIGCATGDTLAIVDSASHSVSVKLTNALSSVPSTPQAAFALSPATVTLASCADVAHVLLVGGSGRYFAASGNDTVYANVDGTNSGIIRRAVFVPARSPPSAIQVTFSDGATVLPVTVKLESSGNGPC